MKNKLIITICIVIVVCLAVVYFSSKNNNNVQSSQDTIKQNISSTKEAKNTNMKENSLIKIDKYVIPVNTNMGGWVLCASKNYTGEKEWLLDFYSGAYAERYYDMKKSEEQLRVFCNSLKEKYKSKVKVKAYKKGIDVLTLEYDDGSLITLDLTNTRKGM